MPTCKQCGSSLEAADLVRYETGDLLLVYCPNCNGLMGNYREPGRYR